ncbi:hypothetical protein [Amycolatopsis sp. MEPSY49]|uniref:hypothetical protein n=1 Tax=Amycolatopsis sp. MEPSY49 TaxID=3151600 RepID=UPI003EF184CC
MISSPAMPGALVADAATARRPRTRYAIGRDAGLLPWLVRVLPDRVLDRITAATLWPYFPR